MPERVTQRLRDKELMAVVTGKEGPGEVWGYLQLGVRKGTTRGVGGTRVTWEK